MLTEEVTKSVLKALCDAGLIIAEARLLGPNHPAGIPNHEYVIGRLEESGAFDLLEVDYDL